MQRLWNTVMLVTCAATITLASACVARTASPSTPAPARASVSRAAGTIYGQVMSPRGTAIRGATVVATSRRNRVRRVTRTGTHGAFRLSRLPPGNYIVRVDFRGRTQSRRVAVHRRMSRSLNFRLGRR